MNTQAKGNWQEPSLEILHFNMTMAGPGVRVLDTYQTDPDEDIHHDS